MKRRLLLAQSASLIGAAHVAARAQPARPARVGFLIAGDSEPGWTLYRKAMTAIGYVEGRTVHYEYRASDANRERLAAHAAALVAANPDVVVAILTPAITAMKLATTSLPIIFNGGAPDVGIVKNLARPEANLTGVHGATTIVAGKAVQLLREIKPSTRTVGVLLNAPDPFNVAMRAAVEAAGREQRCEVVAQMVSAPSDLTAAFEAMAKRGVDGVVVQPSLPLRAAAALAIQHRLPALSHRREFAEVGGLMSFGADQGETYRIMARYTDRVLKGAKPADLPVQTATRFELIINGKTAKALGLTLSPMFLGRVDEVIE